MPPAPGASAAAARRSAGGITRQRALAPVEHHAAAQRPAAEQHARARIGRHAEPGDRLGSRPRHAHDHRAAEHEPGVAGRGDSGAGEVDEAVVRAGEHRHARGEPEQLGTALVEPPGDRAGIERRRQRRHRLDARPDVIAARDRVHHRHADAAADEEARGVERPGRARPQRPAAPRRCAASCGSAWSATRAPPSGSRRARWTCARESSENKRRARQRRAGRVDQQRRRSQRCDADGSDPRRAGARERAARRLPQPVEPVLRVVLGDPRRADRTVMRAPRAARERSVGTNHRRPDAGQPDVDPQRVELVRERHRRDRTARAILFK